MFGKALKDASPLPIQHFTLAMFKVPMGARTDISTSPISAIFAGALQNVFTVGFSLPKSLHP